MPTTPIQNNDPILENLQANILKGHGRDYAHHLFFQFRNEKTEEAKAFIREFASSKITSALNQLEGTAKRNNNESTDGGVVITLSLSAEGYRKLNLQSAMPQNAAFNEGQKSRAEMLSDKIDQWDTPLQEEIHLFIMVADDKRATAESEAQKIIKDVASFAQLLIDQKGQTLKFKGGIGIEHFGYADGISQPLFLANDIANQKKIEEWDDATDVNLVLTTDPGAPDNFGSFLVFRKLEQHVKAFKDAEVSKLPKIKDVDGNENKKLAGAMIVGRFESGSPVIKGSIDKQINPSQPTNDFDYRDDVNLPASKCPFHSHIRLMNPRNGDTQAGDLRAQRITRRGIPYDDVNRFVDEENINMSDELLNRSQPNSGVGLLFMCYQSNIEFQFEILQKFWANEGDIKGHKVDGQDSIIGQGNIKNKSLPKQWGQAAQTDPFFFHGFVTMRGGEYFFTPSIKFLKSI